MTRETNPRTGSTAPRIRTVALAAVADAVLVLIFVAIGRRSHDEDSALLGFATTAWPFLVGAALGWLLARAWRAPLRAVPIALIIWAAAVVAGMLLRAASSQGVQLSFVIVTAVVLALFLLGWRAAVALVIRVRGVRAA